MDEKSLITLEFPKVLEHLAGYASFEASAELARDLRPSTDHVEAGARLARTREALWLLNTHGGLALGGAQDIRSLVELASKESVLGSQDLLAIEDTLTAARDAARVLSRFEDDVPHLAGWVPALTPPAGLIEALSKSISRHGDVLDEASPTLRAVRQEHIAARQRLVDHLQHLMDDPGIAPLLQDRLIQQRNGRYVLPIKAESKRKLRALVQDQSDSGATLFVEPLSAVDLNNGLHEVELAERDEERKVLQRLSLQVGAYAGTLERLTEALAELDLAFMCASYATDLHATEPILDRPEPSGPEAHGDSLLHLVRARHPLIDRQKAVPIDVEMDSQTFTIVITGPNTGGKTVTLKTVGLSAIMAQSGLFIPAESGSRVSLFDDVLADIGDEQSIEQSLSTFSSHITNIIRILRRAGPRTLVLLDELGAGTDPQEGSAIALAILDDLVKRGIPTIVATHYAELKGYAHMTEGVINASVEFDPLTLKPTYHLRTGLPGSSNAIAIAERLGMPPEIIQRARSEIPTADLRAEDLLNEIQRQRELQERATQEAQESLRRAEALRKELGARLDQIEEERASRLEEAQDQADSLLADFQQDLESLRREASRAHASLDTWKELNHRAQLLRPQHATSTEEVAQEEGGLQVGQRVQVRPLRRVGTLAAIDEDSAEVQIGELKVRVRRSEILPLSGEKASTEQLPPHGGPVTPHVASLTPNVGVELDLRGNYSEDARQKLERYLDEAAAQGLPFVRIIHGKGTGKLRQTVQQVLQNSPLVTDWEPGKEGEGGDGVTVAHLVED
jgi:DNA mismatch repair protein MutS2